MTRHSTLTAATSTTSGTITLVVTCSDALNDVHAVCDCRHCVVQPTTPGPRFFQGKAVSSSLGRPGNNDKRTSVRCFGLHGVPAAPSSEPRFAVHNKCPMHVALPVEATLCVDVSQGLLWLHGGYSVEFPYPNVASRGADTGTALLTGIPEYGPYPSLPYYLNDMWTYNFSGCIALRCVVFAFCVTVGVYDPLSQQVDCGRKLCRCHPRTPAHVEPTQWCYPVKSS
jgi:hypothetical protein